MVKTLTKQEKEDVIYRVDQVIANSTIEGIITPPEERELFIQLKIDEASGKITQDQVIEALKKRILNEST